MSVLKRNRNYFFQLVISYVILVISITIIIGFFTSFYLSKIYNQELIQVKQTMLYHVNRIIDESIVKQTKKIYDEIAIENKDNLDLHELFDTPLEGNHILAKSAYDYLNQLVGSNSSLIDSIHIYNIKNDIVISSRNGLAYPNEGMFNMDNLWLTAIREAEANTLWLPAHNIGLTVEGVQNATSIVSFVKVYPAIPGFSRAKGIICINIRVSALYDIISRQQGKDEEILILDADNQLISDGKGISLPEGFINSVLAEKTNAANFEANVAGTLSMVSQAKLSSNGWKTIHITPIKEFRRDLNRIRRMILIICVISILVGFLITSIFSKRMYTPMRSILNRIRGASISRNDQNEYALINNTLDNLTNMVNTLEHTIDENKPLIKHNLITGLIRHTIRNRDDLQTRLDMLKCTFSKTYFYAVLIDMKGFSSRGITMQSSQTAKYNLIKIFENYPDADSLFLASEISDYEIAIVVNTNHSTTDSLQKSLQDIIRTIFSKLHHFPITVIGSSVKTPLEIHDSFAVAQKLQKYVFFLPEEKFISSRKLIDREHSSVVFDNSLMEEFNKYLKMNNLEKVSAKLQQILKQMQNGNYSYNYCYRKLTDIVTQVSEYVRDLGIELRSLESMTVHQQFQQIESVDAFEEWFTQLVQEAFNYLKVRSENKNFTAIEEARKYIIEHIEADLFLDNVAEQVSLKPHYFSKLFKEFTGTTFVAFITANKMEHASKLLLSTDLSGNEISERLSFSSSAYFIKKFKAHFGMTPNEYRSRK
jgi:two-component system, response regulator YesN